jgi:CRP-like cAMP-binding protein
MSRLSHLGGRHPFAASRFERDQLLCLAGDPAEYVWIVQRGAVGLTRSRDATDRPDVLRLPGTYVGLECLIGECYLFTARALSRCWLRGATRDRFTGWLRQDDDRVALVMRAVFQQLLGDWQAVRGLGAGRN